jgi:ABC-type dipeptide/oligopeptide/nickel transport system ATPase component
MMASTAVCPFCFHRIDVSRLWYQCLGRGSAECKKEVDKARQELTKSTLETYCSFPPPEGVNGPAKCTTCGGRTNLRACPECHTALPSNFAESQSPMIGLVGSKGSGKTVLMTVLVKQLRDTIGKRYDADITLATDNPDGHQGVSDYQANREAPLFKGGRLPATTDALGTATRQHAAPVLLRWRQETTGMLGRSSIKSTMLSFVDAAGEDMNAVSSAFTLQYLSVCDGLIVLLDPFALPGARATLNLPAAAINVDEDAPLSVVTNITEMLRVEHALKKNKKISIPVAVVFTKIDAFFPTMERSSPLMASAPAERAYPNADGQSVHENMLALMHQWNAQDIDTHIRLNYSNYRYFGVSALGAEPDYDDGKVAPGGVRPHRVEDPVLWLLSKTGTVRTA